MTTPPLTITPVTSERWPDLAALFGPNGALGGCWCLFWRLERKQFKQQKYDGNRQHMQMLVETGMEPGLLGYLDGQPVAWVSVGPRSEFAALEASRLLKRVDDAAVWSITCFHVARPCREQGLMAQMLRAAVDYAAAHGAQIIEGYPIEVEGHFTPPGGYMGVSSVFRRAGFTEVRRVSDSQSIMRYTIGSRE